MIELRWVVRISVPNSEWSLPTKSKVLQSRTQRLEYGVDGDGSVYGGHVWTDWQDVPTVTE